MNLLRILLLLVVLMMKIVIILFVTVDENSEQDVNTDERCEHPAAGDERIEHLFVTDEGSNHPVVTNERCEFRENAVTTDENSGHAVTSAGEHFNRRSANFRFCKPPLSTYLIKKSWLKHRCDEQSDNDDIDADPDYVNNSSDESDREYEVLWNLSSIFQSRFSKWTYCVVWDCNSHIAGLYDISEVVRGCFEHEDAARIRTYISQKLNHACKIMKRKLDKDSTTDTEQTQQNDSWVYVQWRFIFW